MSLLAQHGLLLAADGAGALWTPADLPVTPHIWLDWNSPITNASGACSQWDNTQGSAGGVFSQGTANRRPAINESAVGGKRGLECDGTDDRILAAGGTLLSVYRNVNQAWMFVVAAQRSTGGSNRQILDVATSFNNTRLGCGAGNGDGGWAVGARRLDSAGAQVLKSTVLADDTNFHCFYGEVDYSASPNAQALVSIDGNTPDTASPFLTTGNTSNTNSARISIGGNASDNEFGYMTIVAIISGSGSRPSIGDKQRLEGWAMWQLGLEGNLPAGHPYKSAPPYV